MWIGLNADDAGEPGALIAATEEKAFTTTSSGHWEELAFTSLPPTVEGVNYGAGCRSGSACARSCPRGATRAGPWSMDFASDALWTGRRFRCLCLVDDATRESPALLPDFAIGGEQVVRLLDDLACRHGLPEEIVMDNGPESTGRALFAWSARTGLRFIQPGKPIQNAFAESFIGRFRDECLNQHWFGSLAEASRIIEAWRRHYNRERPHSALGYQPPERFARPLGAPGLDDGPRPRRRSLRHRARATTSTAHLHPGPNFGGGHADRRP